MRLTENAMSLSLAGDPKAAVKNLIFHGNATMNGKLIETAQLVLNRYATKIDGADVLGDMVNDLKAKYSPAGTRPALGEQKRQAGGLSLRTGTAASSSKVTAL